MLKQITAVVASVALAALAIGCAKSSKTNTDNPTEDNKPAGHNPDGPKEQPVVEMDPSDPESWKKAEAIAAKAAMGKLEKRSDALPFMFMADMPAAVLVHKGRVVTEKGPAAAGAYLRDLGIVDGEGPEINDVLFVLFAFKAWPPIKEVPEQGYVNNDDPSLEDLTARIEYETDQAKVVLHYFLPEPPPPPEDLEVDVGSIDPNATPTAVRPIARATLLIPRTGDARWLPIEKLNWAQ